MVLAVARRLLVENLLTRPRLVIVPLTLLSIHVSDIVSILFFKLVSVNFFAELLLPELK